MSTLAQVHASNAQIATTLPQSLTSVFVGATSGIGEAALKEWVQQVKKPKCYFVGRSHKAARRIIEECKEINPDANLIFIAADMSLVKEADRVCEEIKKNESEIHLLFLSAGAVIMDGSKTEEGLHAFTALAVYTRARMTQNLLPLLRRSTSLARVINIAGGTKEGYVYLDDLQGLKVPITGIRGHLTSMITLIQEHFATEAPDVSFVHVFPGAVKTPLFDNVPGLLGFVARTMVALTSFLFGSWLWIQVKESGERSVFISTSKAFPAKEDRKSEGVPLVEGLGVRTGVNGEIGSGRYSVDYDGTELKKKTQALLANYAKKGMVEKIWDHVQGEFTRITSIKQ